MDDIEEIVKLVCDRWASREKKKRGVVEEGRREGKRRERRRDRGLTSVQDGERLVELLHSIRHLDK